jgi:predicted permease
MGIPMPGQLNPASRAAQMAALRAGMPVALQQAQLAQQQPGQPMNVR